MPSVSLLPLRKFPKFPSRHATSVSIRVWSVHDSASIEVADDGIGGADPSVGSGLSGLADRVEALGGALVVRSPRGRGTTVVATVPMP